MYFPVLALNKDIMSWWIQGKLVTNDLWSSFLSIFSLPPSTHPPNLYSRLLHHQWPWCNPDQKPSLFLSILSQPGCLSHLNFSFQLQNTTLFSPTLQGEPMLSLLLQCYSTMIFFTHNLTASALHFSIKLPRKWSPIQSLLISLSSPPLPL